MVKGIDNGYLYTKDNEKRIFRSAYSVTDYTMSDIIIDGTGYTVGSGNFTVDVDKTHSDINKICTIYNLALSGPQEYYIVAGLPIAQFKTQRESFREAILKYNGCEVIFKDQQFKYKISDVFIFPQGAAALMTADLKDGEYIIFDIGGLTIDIGYIEISGGKPIMIKNDTWYKGAQKLYSQIIHVINNRFSLTLEPRYSEKILVHGLEIDGEVQDISFLEPIFNNYIEPIITELQLNYPSKTTKIYLCGGGVTALGGIFLSRFKSVIILPDSQFANAIGYYNIGCRRFDKYIKGVKI